MSNFFELMDRFRTKLIPRGFFAGENFELPTNSILLNSEQKEFHRLYTFF